MSMKRTMIALFTLLVAAPAIASGLFTPYSLSSAAVLPKGVKRLGYSGFTTEISNEYGNRGGIEVLGADFNKKLTVGELIKATPAGKDRGIFKGGLEASGLGMGETAGQANGWIDARVTTSVPTLAYGVSDRWTLAVGIPIIYSNMHPATGWTVDPQFEAKLNKLATNGYRNPIGKYQADLQNVIQTELKNYGYDPLVDQSQTGIGDVVIAGKYQALKNRTLTVAISPRVSLPTGRASDVNKVVDLAPGDGHPNFGVAAISDYWIRPRLIWTSSLSYTYQTPMVRAKRIPLEASNWISPDVDNSAHQKAGDILGTSTGLRYEVLPAVTLGAGYSFQYKAPDKYTGNHFDPTRYNYLSVETEQTMHALDIGVQYSTVPLFRAHKFEIPLDIGIDYATVLVGRNTKKIELAAIELASYF